MAVDAPALNKEEQELFEKMQKEEGAKTPPAKAADKPAEKSAPKAEDKPADKAAEKAADKPPSMVPAEALKEARAQNKELRKEIDGLKALVQEGDKKLKSFVEGMQKRAEEAAKPKFEDNPAEALRLENEDLKKGLAEVREKLQKQDAAAQQGSEIQKHAAAVRAKELAFAKEHPDYDKAAEYVAGVWREEFAEAGFDEDVIPGMVFQKSLAMTRQALAKEKDPAEAIWKIALRNGYKAKGADEPKKEEAKASDGENKLKTIEKGLEAAKTAGGGLGPDEMTLATIAQMDDDQLDKLIKDPDWWNKNVRRSPLH